jgi:hypothetical protein
MGKLFTEAARWLFLFVLAYAPWAYACIPPWAVGLMNVLLALVLLGWGLGCYLRRRWPRVPLTLAAAAFVLVCLAWWMALNAQTHPWQDGLVQATSSKPLAWAPGAVHRGLSLGAAQRTTALLGVLLLVCDLAGNPVWRRRLWRTMALVGLSLVGLGLLQRLLGAPGPFWRLDPQGPTFFATFNYHANAGSFINLVWPLIAGLLLGAVFDREPRERRLFWLISLVLCLTAVLVNTSRGGSFLAVVLCLVWLGWLALQSSRQGWLNGRGAALLATLAFIAAVVGGLAWTVGMGRTLERWRAFDRELSSRNTRLRADQLSLDIAQEAGLWGFGPGTYSVVYQSREPVRLGPLEYAHNDYLQTVIEWGWGGSAFWAVVFLGGPFTSLWWRVQSGRRLRQKDRVLHLAALLAWGGVALHALVDYPLQVGAIQLYVAALLGLFWGSRRWLAPPPVAVPAKANSHRVDEAAPVSIATVGEFLDRKARLRAAGRAPNDQSTQGQVEDGAKAAE